MLELETPGGLLTSMRKITQAELRSPVPIIAYVAPSGARAASAGFFLLQAADLAAMVPASNTGAATPIDMGGGNVGSDLRAKLIQDAEAQVRFLADGSGRNGTAAAAGGGAQEQRLPALPAQLDGRRGAARRTSSTSSRPTCRRCSRRATGA